MDDTDNDRPPIDPTIELILRDLRDDPEVPFWVAEFARHFCLKHGIV